MSIQEAKIINKIATVVSQQLAITTTTYHLIHKNNNLNTYK
jgi:hypothetical protein